MALLLAILFSILPPCPTEDSNNCKWDATVQGNREGNSFVVVMDLVFYVETD